jgi:hypothetical protein
MTQTLERIRPEAAAREEAVLIDRLMRRQGVSQDEALRLVDGHKRGLAVEIDPVMLEGLESL